MSDHHRIQPIGYLNCSDQGFWGTFGLELGRAFYDRALDDPSSIYKKIRSALDSCFDAGLC